MGKEWYCIISGRDDYGWSKIISEKVVADTKSKARKIIEDSYCRPLPMRIRNKDISDGSILLSMYEMKEGEYQAVHDLFASIECKQCGKEYRKIDTYNLNLFSDIEFCSSNCRDVFRGSNFIPSEFNNSVPVIYRISEKKTGMCYVGKTIRSFTRRWWEHLKSTDGCKFHKRLQETELTDWLFEVVEVIPNGTESEIFEAETKWINKMDSIECGYNSVISKNMSKP